MISFSGLQAQSAFYAQRMHYTYYYYFKTDLLLKFMNNLHKIDIMMNTLEHYSDSQLT